MITKEEILAYIERIPPVPKVVEETLKLLQLGELPKAAKVAQEDPALASYLRNLVNKPIYGFKTEVKEISQIFGIFGVSKSQQVIYSYLLGLLSPDEWQFFQLNQKKFYSLQDELVVSWNKILSHLNVKDKDIETAITLLPSSIIVAEALFSAKKDEVALIRGSKDLDLSTILQRLTGYTLFEISTMIAKKWEMNQKVSDIILCASAQEENCESESEQFGKWMHLLLFYILSKPQYIESGLNDFIEFNVEFVSDIYDEFSSVMEIEA